MVMRNTIADIARVSYGKHWISHSKGDALVLTGSNFNELGAFIDRNLSFTHSHAPYLLREGDILLQNKGISRNVLLYSESIGKAVASSMYYVIRPHQNQVLPYYLYTFLKSSLVQSVLLRSSEGTSTPSLRKSELEDIEIPLPSITVQKELVQLFLAINKDIQLTDSLLQLKKLRNTTLLNQLFNSYDR
ncbi:MAG: restriction endonuclease subunit S [Chlamydiae bacterium]|nr:restriction endonuclease subunit S [Chlamydiota bacterium]